jgi:AcrR family transcriptional regulator
MSQVDGPATLREQQRAYTRRRLMEAGQQVFAAKGYPDTRVDDIARQAGASRATFYLHFKSKCELMTALVDDWTPFAVETYHVLDEMLEDDGPQLPGRLRGWLAQWLEVWTTGADVNRAMLQATMLESDVELHHLRLSQALVDGLEHYNERMPARRRGAARNRALLLEMMTQRIFALASQSMLPISGDRLLDILTQMWMEVLVAGWPEAEGPGQPG